MNRPRPDPVISALEGAIRYLCEAQHPSGAWTDFWTAVGTSDEWVTAYVGLALAEACARAPLPPETRRCAARATRAGAGWLLTRTRPDGGWGYNGSVGADADSTAHAVCFLAALEEPLPATAVPCLERHRTTGGFGTYAFSDPAHQWTQPCPDVTASALRALYRAGRLDAEQLREQWQQVLAPARQPDGSCPGYWWTTPHYTTALVLETWALAGGRPLVRPLPSLGWSSAFDGACALLAQAWMERDDEAAGCLQKLLPMQQPDGAWPGTAGLRIPPSHPQGPAWPAASFSRDARRIFTTATALRGLCAASPLIAARPGRTLGASTAAGTRSCLDPGRSALGRTLDQVLAGWAVAVGFDAQAAARAGELLQRLTGESLDERTDWPAPQLSALSGGMPLEFSVSAAATPDAALRYTVEPGDVQAPPERRARSALAAIQRAARWLGYDEAWARVAPALELLLSAPPVPSEWLRFWLWAGVDHVWRSEGGQDTVVKIYARLDHREPRRRLIQALAAAGIPLPPPTMAACDLIEGEGFAQEVGFGLGPGGRFGCKVYFELPGWRRGLVERLLPLVGLPPDVEALCPAIPQLLKESLASRSRAGVSLRLDALSGRVDEVSTAAEFIQGFLPPSTVAERVDVWLQANGWDSRPHRQLFEVLASFADAQSRTAGPRHTLFTRTLSRGHDRRATIYVRAGLSG